MEMKNTKDKKTNYTKGEVILIEEEKKPYFKVIDEYGEECKVYVTDKIKLKVMSKHNYKNFLIEYVKDYQRKGSQLGGKLVSIELEEGLI